MSLQDNNTIIPVGIDIGVRNARVAIISKADTQSKISPEPSIVTNELGQRYTLALSVVEPKAEDDPLNDQYWDNPNSSKKVNPEPVSVNYIHGDAARRTLDRLKKPLQPHLVLNLIKDSISCQNDDSENVNEQAEKMEAAASFFCYLNAQTANASGTGVHPSALRYVVAIPPTNQSTAQTQTFITSLSSGIIKSIRQIGWDNAPELLSASLNKKEKKMAIKSMEMTNRIIGVITHPVAIAHAHGLFETADTPEISWKNTLVLDWGASSLSLTHLKKVGSTQTTSIMRSEEHTVSCGLNILDMLVKHTAEIFERGSRGMIPRGETLQNKKAKAKLEVACEDVLRSLGYSTKARVTVDGLIDGIDCHVEVMLARFEMLLGHTLKTAEKAIQDVIASSGVQFDVVLGAGGVMRMKCVQTLINRIFSRENDAIWRGKSTADVAPEEAAAIGCAKFGHQLVQSSVENGIEPNIYDSSETASLVEEDVIMSPIGIGLSLQEGDPAAVIVIEEGTPLPALVTKTIDTTGCSSSLAIVQLRSSSTADTSEKNIGKIEGIDSSSNSAEVTMELSIEGRLSICVNGGSKFVL